jgi:hypothetical protein
MDHWIMDIGDSLGADIVTGIPLLTGVNLIGSYPYDEFPPGRLLAYDESGTGKNAGRYDLGNDIKLLYQTIT